MYRQYATLYVVFCVDKAENELAILDLIQVSALWADNATICFSAQIFVEAMDRCFESVCELDIIFNMDKVGHISWVASSVLLYTPPIGYRSTTY